MSLTTLMPTNHSQAFVSTRSLSISLLIEPISMLNLFLTELLYRKRRLTNTMRKLTLLIKLLMQNGMKLTTPSNPLERPTRKQG